VIEGELLEFVRFAVRSVWNVELLLHLRKSAERSWAPEKLVRELRASASVVTDGLRTLQDGGLVAPDEAGRWRYAPASAAFDGLAGQLERLYRERPTAVTQALFARSDKLRTFADAFRLRKD
jgi:DNA-binding IclR family transcriptional regulator